MIHTHLKVPSHWEHYWTKYPEGYTILEALLNWVNQVNGMTDNLNEMNERLDEFIRMFEADLQDTVATMLEDWKEDGTLAHIINEVVFGELSGRVDDLEEKMSDIAINVRFFGAIGDGISDDTLPLQLAFDSGVGLVKLEKDKVYAVSEPLYIPDNLTIDFQGATIRAIGDKPFMMFYIEDKENIVLKNGKVSAIWKTGYESNDFIVLISSSQNIKVENMEFTNVISDAIYIGYNYNYRGLDRFRTKNIEVSNCHIHHIGRNGIALVSGDNVHIHNNVFEDIQNNAPKSCIDIEPETGTNHFLHLDSIVIENNTFRGGYTGVLIAQYGHTENGTIQIVNNIFDNCQFALNGIPTTTQGPTVIVDGASFINQSTVMSVFVVNNPLATPLILKNLYCEGTSHSNTDAAYYGFITLISNHMDGIGNITIDGVSMKKSPNKFPSILNVNSGWVGEAVGLFKNLYVADLKTPLYETQETACRIFVKQTICDPSCDFSGAHVPVVLSNYYVQSLKMYTDAYVKKITESYQSFELQTNLPGKVCSLSVANVSGSATGMELIIPTSNVKFADNTTATKAWVTSTHPFKLEYVVHDNLLYFINGGELITSYS